MTTLHDRAKLAIRCFIIFYGPVSQLLGFKKKVKIINQVLQLYIFHIVCQLYKSAYAFVSTVQQYCISICMYLASLKAGCLIQLYLRPRRGARPRPRTARLGLLLSGEGHSFCWLLALSYKGNILYR